MWRYFKFRQLADGTVDKTRVTCLRCGKQMCYRQSTSVMHNHLKFRHKIFLRSSQQELGRLKHEHGLAPLTDLSVVPQSHVFRSKVWEHFVFGKNDAGEVDKLSVVCRHCGRSISYCSTTSSMRQHLLRLHDIDVGTRDKRRRTELQLDAATGTWLEREVSDNEAQKEQSDKDADADVRTEPIIGSDRETAMVTNRKRPVSEVWRYFRHPTLPTAAEANDHDDNSSTLDKTQVECLRCNRRLSYCQSSTSTMVYHLRRHHNIHVRTQRVQLSRKRVDVAIESQRRRARRARSQVWEYFKKRIGSRCGAGGDDKVIVFCMICDQEFISSKTPDLIRHLTDFHRISFKQQSAAITSHSKVPGPAQHTSAATHDDANDVGILNAGGSKEELDQYVKSLIQKLTNDSSCVGQPETDTSDATKHAQQPIRFSGSRVWQYFDRLGRAAGDKYQKVRCRLCNIVKSHDSSTKHMLRHMRRKHKIIVPVTRSQAALKSKVWQYMRLLSSGSAGADSSDVNSSSRKCAEQAQCTLCSRKFGYDGCTSHLRKHVFTVHGLNCGYSAPAKARKQKSPPPPQPAAIWEYFQQKDTTTTAPGGDVVVKSKSITAVCKDCGDEFDCTPQSASVLYEHMQNVHDITVSAADVSTLTNNAVKSKNGVKVPPRLASRSRVWQYFSFPVTESGDVDKTEAVCNLCNYRSKYYEQHSSTSNMVKHLRSSHSINPVLSPNKRRSCVTHVKLANGRTAAVIVNSNIGTHSLKAESSDVTVYTDQEVAIIWKYFGKFETYGQLDKSKVICQLCYIKVKYQNTYLHMVQHLLSDHDINIKMRVSDNQADVKHTIIAPIKREVVSETRDDDGTQSDATDVGYYESREIQEGAVMAGDDAVVARDDAIVAGDNAVVTGDNAVGTGDNAVVAGENAVVTDDDETEELPAVPLGSIKVKEEIVLSADEDSSCAPAVNDDGSAFIDDITSDSDYDPGANYTTPKKRNEKRREIFSAHLVLQLDNKSGAQSQLSSKVWQYFGFYKKCDDDGSDSHGANFDKTRAVCQLCRASYRYFSSTSNLHRHLHKHGINLLDSSPPSPNEAMTGRRGLSRKRPRLKTTRTVRSSKRQQLQLTDDDDDDDAEQVDDTADVDDAVSGDACCESAAALTVTPSPPAKGIDTAASTSYATAFSKFSQIDGAQTQTDALLLRYLLNTSQSLSAVENPHFRAFITALNPHYTSPSLRSLRDTHLPRLYDSTQQQVRERLRQVRRGRDDGLVFSVHRWRHRTQQQQLYVSISCHVMMDDWQPQSYLLTSRRLDDAVDQTGEAMFYSKTHSAFLSAVCSSYTVHVLYMHTYMYSYLYFL